MAWCRQATSHYLSQCWPSPMSQYDITRSQWVKSFNFQWWLQAWMIMARNGHSIVRSCSVLNSSPCELYHDYQTIIHTQLINKYLGNKTFSKIYTHLCFIYTSGSEVKSILELGQVNTIMWPWLLIMSRYPLVNISLGKACHLYGTTHYCERYFIVNYTLSNKVFSWHWKKNTNLFIHF